LERILATVKRVLNSRAAVLHLVEAERGHILDRAELRLKSATALAAPSFARAVDAQKQADGQDPVAVFEAYPLFLAAHAGLEPEMLKCLPSSHDAASPWVQVVMQQSVVVHPSLPAPISVGEGLLAACVSVPVRAKGSILGVLSVLVESIDRFSAEDIALLAAISDHVGGAVERSRLFQRAEEAAVIEERQRLARDLHDSVTQSLYSLVLFAEAGKDALTAGHSEKALSHMHRLSDTSQQALKEMRLLIYELRPLALQNDALVGALRHRLEAVERRSGMDARLIVENLTPLPERVEVGLYGIAQEALNNVIKHARATSLVVRLNAQEKEIVLEISDNGKGFSPEHGWQEDGVGMASMRERTRALGGNLTVHSQPGQGTSILVRINQEDRK